MQIRLPTGKAKRLRNMPKRSNGMTLANRPVGAVKTAMTTYRLWVDEHTSKPVGARVQRLVQSRPRKRPLARNSDRLTPFARLPAVRQRCCSTQPLQASPMRVSSFPSSRVCQSHGNSPIDPRQKDEEGSLQHRGSVSGDKFQHLSFASAQDGILGVPERLQMNEFQKTELQVIQMV
jgi:hypothetical protein